jgi:hypothetical protein
MKNLKNFIVVSILLFGLGCNQPAEKDHADNSPGYHVASYYFPNYHMNDNRNTILKGYGWSEWELVKDAKLRFEGHQQPNIPAWGYTNESDPRVMEMKIDAAADYGIDAFIFDWYYYDDGPFLEKCLEDGYLKARNNERVKFSLMWANHDWIDIHPCTKEERIAGPKLLYPGKVTLETWDHITDYVIENYFSKPSYWKIDGQPYFSIYDLTRFIDIFGSVENTKTAIEKFRKKAIDAGFSGLNLNAVVWGRTVLPSEEIVENINELVKELGFTSVTSYVWIHHVKLDKFPVTPYQEVQDKYFEYAAKTAAESGLPYYPNATMGWDSSPRANQNDSLVNVGYPFMASIGGNTPEAFKSGLEVMKTFLKNNPSCGNTFNINCWNEWTEGSYLEPDLRNGYKYLEAIKEVFGEKND